MISFEQYHEAFSLKNLFFRKKNEELSKKKRVALQPARENFKKLKNILASKGYCIMKSDEGDYHLRREKTIGLSPQKDNTINLRNEPNFLMVLFTLAHETGHALQWDENTNSRDRTSDKMNEMYDYLSQHSAVTPSWKSISTQDPQQWKVLTELYGFWYEIDAWIKGMKFIPPLMFLYIKNMPRDATLLI